ncbi:MAG: hypothetical protein RLZZ495_1150 [Pseudomonadota bacterium]|jgi:hypothetical protein
MPTETLIPTPALTQQGISIPSPEPEAVDAADDEEEQEIEIGQILHRHDGYYWQATGSKQEIGPFTTLEEAFLDMQSSDEDMTEPGETLGEAESELGLSDWIDPDTGKLAEGLSTPHLHDE